MCERERVTAVASRLCLCVCACVREGDMVTNRVGYHLNFIDSDSDSAYRFRFFSIPSFDSNVIK